MRNSINYNLDQRDELNDRWWKAALELKTKYSEEYKRRWIACNGQIGFSTAAQVATLETWLKEIKASGEVRQSQETGA